MEPMWDCIGFFHKDLYFFLFFGIATLLARRLVCRRLIIVFDFSSAYYNFMFFVVLLRRFICLGAIKTSKADSISKISYYDCQYVDE